MVFRHSSWEEDSARRYDPKFDAADSDRLIFNATLRVSKQHQPPFRSKVFLGMDSPLTFDEEDAAFGPRTGPDRDLGLFFFFLLALAGCQSDLLPLE